MSMFSATPRNIRNQRIEKPRYRMCRGDGERLAPPSSPPPALLFASRGTDVCCALYSIDRRTSHAASTALMKLA